MVQNRLKTDRILLIWLVLTIIWNMVAQFTPTHHISTISYSVFCLFWVYTLVKEIPDIYVRHGLMAGGLLSILPFVLRFLKWDVVPDGSLASRMCWYGYYVSVIITPVISLLLSLYIGSRDDKRQKRFGVIVCSIAVILLSLLFSNDSHGLVLKITYENGREHSSAGPVFFVILAWYFVLVLASFLILIYKCRISSRRGYWYIPVLTEVIGILLIAVYFINGSSSPRIRSISLYNVQEVYMILFILPWECCIMIGLIPSVSLIKEKDWIKDGILETVRGELEQIYQICSRMWKQDGKDYERDLITLCKLGVYIKRRANLELITDSRGYLNTRELSIAIAETLEYYSLSGMATGYEETGECEIPALILTAAYELFDTVVFDKQCNACYVRLSSKQDDGVVKFKMIIEVDVATAAGVDPVDEIYRKNPIDIGLLEMMGVAVTVKNEDDTTYIELNASYRQGVDVRRILRMGTGRKSDMTYGLSGLIYWLSVEDEALRIKMRIHDGMGRCLLMSRRFLTHPEEVGRDALFTEWSRVTAQVTGSDTGVIYDPENINTYHIACLRQAKAMGIEVDISGQLPKEEKWADAVDSAITTHITNILKHTEDRRAIIRVIDKPDSYVMTFTNDSDCNIKTVRMTGGLKNLKNRIERLGGKVEVCASPKFVIRLLLPKEAGHE